CSDRAQAIQEHALCRACSTCSSPMDHHACLRQREGQECANGIQRDEPVGDSTENRQQNRGEDGESIDPLSKDQAPSSQSERVRQKAIKSNGPGKAWEV